jgi:hypothetical protein
MNNGTTNNTPRFIVFCIEGLKRMYHPGEHVFSASYRQKDGNMTHIRNSSQEFKYGMNTIMGLHKARVGGAEVPFDLEGDFRFLLGKIDEPYVTEEDIAAAAWTGAVLGEPLPSSVISSLKWIIEEAAGRLNLTAQTMAWLGLSSLAIGGEGLAGASAVVSILLQEFVHPESRLVRHRSRGVRADWASFAASCYVAYTLLLYGRQCADERAVRTGIEIARSLVGLQGTMGQWPWFYYVPGGRIADFYRVYAVHQEAMAPFFLLEAIDQGYCEFIEPLRRGFRWILGNNELDSSLVSREHCVVWRSLCRNHRFEKGARMLRAFVSRTGYRDGPAGPERVTVDRECRSYELGWSLWAFGSRIDFRELLDDGAFALSRSEE